MKRRRTFNREFKLEAAKLVRDRGVSIAQASRELDVHENVLGKWAREFAADPAQAFPGWVLLLTGARLREVLSLRWEDQVDTEGFRWVDIERSKTGNSSRLEAPEELSALLRERWRRRRSPFFVFPGWVNAGGWRVQIDRP